MTLQPLAIKRSISQILGDTFRSLRHRNYKLFFFGQLISLIGTWLQNTALSWLVYDLTKNPMTLGVVSFLGSIPVLFLSLIAGTVADEYPKRRILVMTQAASGLQAILLAVAIWTGNATIAVIAIANFLLGVVNAFDLPTRQAFVVEMASKEDVTNAVALNSSVFNTARLIGPALGGIIISLLSIGMCFFLNGISYIAVIAGLLMMRFTAIPIHKRAENSSRLAAMKEGVGYLYDIKQLRILMILVIGMTLFGWSYSVNLPVVAGDLLKGGASSYSALLSANGVGALLAALSQAAMAGKLDARRMVFVGIGVFIVSLAGLSMVHTLWMAMIMLVFVGWGLITFFITANTTLQRQVPDDLRGRVMSIYSLAFAGLFPFGSLLAGYVADQFGVASAFQLNAAILFLFALPSFLIIRRLPKLGRLAAEQPTAQEDMQSLLKSETEVIREEQITKG